MLQVQVNQASGTGATALNWATAIGGTPLVITSRTPATDDAERDDRLQRREDPDRGQRRQPQRRRLRLRQRQLLFQTGGDLFVIPSGTNQTVHVNVLELGISNAQIFAGVGATDSSGAGGIGVKLSNVQLGLALMSEIGGTGRKFTALDASGTATLVGMPSGLGSAARSRSRSTTAPARTPVDFTKLPAGKLSIPTSAGPSPPTVDLAFTGQLLEIAGSLTLTIDSVRLAHRQLRLRLRRHDRPSRTPRATARPARACSTIGASGVTAFFGANGLGLSITNASLALALITPTAPLDGATSFLALQATGNVSLVGITGVTASMQSVDVDVNEASGTGPGAQPLGLAPDQRSDRPELARRPRLHGRPLQRDRHAQPVDRLLRLPRGTVTVNKGGTLTERQARPTARRSPSLDELTIGATSVEHLRRSRRDRRARHRRHRHLAHRTSASGSSCSRSPRRATTPCGASAHRSAWSASRVLTLNAQQISMSRSTARARPASSIDFSKLPGWQPPDRRHARSDRIRAARRSRRAATSRSASPASRSRRTSTFQQTTATRRLADVHGRVQRLRLHARRDRRSTSELGGAFFITRTGVAGRSSSELRSPTRLGTTARHRTASASARRRRSRSTPSTARVDNTFAGVHDLPCPPGRLFAITLTLDATHPLTIKVLGIAATRSPAPSRSSRPTAA